MRLKNYLLKGLVTLGIIVSTVVLVSSAQAQANGEALFKSKCASCHHPVKKLTGPALKGVNSRVPDKEWLYKWVKNSTALISSGDKYANEVFNANGKTAMTGFPELKNEEIDAIIDYVENFKSAASKSEDSAGGKSEGSKSNNDNDWMYILFTLILAGVAIVLIYVNRILAKNEAKELGEKEPTQVPFYRHKAYIALFAIIVFVTLGYFLSNYLIGLGRQQGYQPKQSIFYSHKVHAGVNQINCMYCHSSADKSKMAMIPSTNVCMNCHAAINEYTGEQLFDAEGNKVDGTAQIKELYKYAGWNEEKGTYNRDANGKIIAKPIEWIRIHNLPDHVYFNHSQHVKVGEVACQSCHGDIQEMDEVYQYSDLSMGFCINCHRSTKTQFDNKSGFYHNTYKKYAEQLKSGEIDSVTVEMIGGTECQKCHY